jgi:hypothetical protein
MVVISVPPLFFDYDKATINRSSQQSYSTSVRRTTILRDDDVTSDRSATQTSFLVQNITDETVLKHKVDSTQHANPDIHDQKPIVLPYFIAS